MDSYIVRTYDDASFLFDKRTSNALFFEGFLADLAPSLLNNSIKEIPKGILNDLDPKDHDNIKEDFQEMKIAIDNFISKKAKADNKNQEITENEAKTVMEELSDYAVKHWQIVNASIELTHCCNQRCEWCYLEDFIQKGLNIEDLQRIAKQLSQIGAIFILFTGGEIFVRPDTLEIMEEFNNYGFALELKTNGLALTPEIIHRLEKLNLFNLQVSLYDINDGWSELTNSYYQSHSLKQNILLLQELGIPLSVAVLVGNHNIEQLDLYKEWLDKIGVKEVFYNPYITPNRNGPGNEISYRLSYQQMEEKFLPFLKKVDGLFSPREYRNSSCENQPACYAGRDQIAIDTQGVVYPYLDLRLPLGNIKEEKLQEILEKREKILKPFRLNTIPKCHNCDIKKYCDSCVGTALLENGDFKVPSQHKCDISRFYYANRKEVVE
ncbi:radical SAM protein [Patescibacteria group bacterium]